MLLAGTQKFPIDAWNNFGQCETLMSQFFIASLLKILCDLSGERFTVKS
jgi:hypothetical protein